LIFGALLKELKNFHVGINLWNYTIISVLCYSGQDNAGEVANFGLRDLKDTKIVIWPKTAKF